MDKTFAVVTPIGPVSDLLSELSDALEILYSCRRMSVPVSDDFLDHIDELIDQIEASRPYVIPA